MKMEKREEFTKEDLENEIEDIKDVTIMNNKIVYTVDYKRKYDKVCKLTTVCIIFIVFLTGLITGLLFYI